MLCWQLSPIPDEACMNDHKDRAAETTTARAWAFDDTFPVTVCLAACMTSILVLRRVI